MVILYVGCIRSFDTLTVDEAAPLAVEPAFANVAPRESITLQISGGLAPYSLAFEGSGAASGVDASLSDSNVYQAGSRPGSVDVVLITDAAGLIARARFTVGAALSLTPPQASVAPGGTVLFTATGGKPPYAFTLTAADAAIDGAGVYRAGATGDRVDTLVATDALGQSSPPVSIHITTPLTLITSAEPKVAPNEPFTVFALGGQPPYLYEMELSASGGNIDATGRYRAGLVGEVQDIVRVTDSNLQQRVQPIDVTPGLVLSLETTPARPHADNYVVAQGGKAPYTFAFAPKGNRSHGTIEALGGRYRPGPVAAAMDLVIVTDATGHTSEPLPIGVGSWLLPVVPQFFGPDHKICLVTDFDGDAHEELSVMARTASGMALTVAITSDSGVALRTMNIPKPGTGEGYYSFDALTADFSSDGHSDLAILTPSTLRILYSDFAGNLVPFWDIDRPAGSNGGTSVQQIAGVQGALGWSLFFPAQYDPFNGVAECDPYLSGLMRLDLWDGVWSGPSCAVAAAIDIVALAAGSWGSNDGSLTSAGVAWVESGSENTIRSRINPTFDTRTTAPATLDLDASTFVNALLTAKLPANDQLLALRGPIEDISDTLVYLAYGSGNFSAAGTLSLPSDSAEGGASLRPAAQDGLLWAGTLAQAFSYTASTVTAGEDLGATVANIQCVAYPDIDGDATPDLAIVTRLAEGEVLLGEGDGSFGKKPHAPTHGVFNPLVVDVDNDGISDIVALTSQQALQVLWGSGRELALGPRSSFPHVPNQSVYVKEATALTAGSFSSSGNVDLAVAVEHDIVLALGNGAGAFSPSVLAVSEGNGTLSVSEDILRTAELAGAAPGLDLLAYQDYGSAPKLIVRDSPTHAVAYPIPFVPNSSYPCLFEPFDVNDNGVDDLVAVCVTGGTFLQAHTALVTSDAGGVTFGAWVPLGDPISHAGQSAGSFGVIGHTAASVYLFAGREMGPPRGQIVTVTPGAATPVVASALDFQPAFGAALADVTGDGRLDLVTSDQANASSSAAVHVLRGEADNTFTELIDGGSTRLPLAIPGTVLGPYRSTLDGPTDVFLYRRGHVMTLLNALDGHLR